LIVLHPYSNPPENKKYKLLEQAPTWEALKEIRKKYVVVDRECEGLMGYDDFILEYWTGKEAFLVIEHDIVATLEQIDSLARCNGHLVCDFRYDYGGRFINPPGFAYLGCTKYSKEAQTLVPAKEWHGGVVPKNEEPWAGTYGGGWFNLDTRLSLIMQKHITIKDFVHHHDEFLGLVKHTRSSFHNIEDSIGKQKEEIANLRKQIRNDLKGLPQWQELQNRKKAIRELDALLRKQFAALA
jgi:hypothetical protein